MWRGLWGQETPTITGMAIRIHIRIHIRIRIGIRIHIHILGGAVIILIGMLITIWGW